MIPGAGFGDVSAKTNDGQPILKTGAVQDNHCPP